MRLLVCVEPIDFRNGIDGLVCICRQSLREDPFRGTLFVFRNRRCTAIKVLAYDGQGFWLCQKRLSSGRFTWWPDGATATTLAAHELHALLAAGDPRGVKAPPAWRPIGAPPSYFPGVERSFGPPRHVSARASSRCLARVFPLASRRVFLI